MKMTLEIEGDFYEDSQQFKDILFCKEMGIAIIEARECIRKVLKYEDCCENKIKLLEEILEILYVEGIEL